MALIKGTTASSIIFDLAIIDVCNNNLPSHFDFGKGGFDHSDLRYFPVHFEFMGGYLSWIKPYWVDLWGIETQVPNYVTKDEDGNLLL